MRSAGTRSGLGRCQAPSPGGWTICSPDFCWPDAAAGQTVHLLDGVTSLAHRTQRADALVKGPRMRCDRDRPDARVSIRAQPILDHIGRADQRGRFEELLRYGGGRGAILPGEEKVLDLRCGILEAHPNRELVVE